MYRYSMYNYEYEIENGYIVINFINDKKIFMSKETFKKYKNFENYLKDEDVKKMIELGLIVKKAKIK